MSRRNRLLVLCGALLVVLSIASKAFLDSIYSAPILMYHSIDYTRDKKDRMTVSPEIFAKQMKYLHDHKYNVVPLEKAVSYIAQEKAPPKTVAITFDDGYENNYEHAYPVLKKYNIPATIFVIVNMIGKKGFLTWDQIKEMSDSGLIDIESHTKSHPWLATIDDTKARHELADSKAILEKGLGTKIRFICYPMNNYSENVKSMAREAGYEAGFATKPTGVAPCYDVYEIKRVRISPTSNNLFVFAIKLSGYHAFYRMLHNDYRETAFIKWKKGS